MKKETLFRYLIAIVMLYLQQVSLASEKTASVMARDGNIYLQKQDKGLVQLTHSGKDRNPVLSSDGRTYAFIRQTEEPYSIDADAGYDCNDLFTDRLWVGVIDGEQNMIDPNTSETDKNLQIYDDSVHFSTDGKKIYYIASCWVTSGAVCSVDIEGSKPSFIIPGNSLQFLSKGKYKGHLIVNQHRYFIAGGSYDWFWLFDPKGKEIGPIGPDLNEGIMWILQSD